MHEMLRKFLRTTVGLITRDMDSPPTRHSLPVDKPLEQVVEPNNLYSASGELFFSGVGVAWVVTLACEAWYIDGNELKKRIGYNNVCVGFDMPPASYVAMPVLVISSAMGIAYVWMDTQRGLLQKVTGREERSN